ncbi:MAG: bifunctional hydroxymethylpyrimidine kinase/phosphomethylpyrimidine kinase [Acidobacteriaceae bacterium]|nr:bifunctional hydroxymethylpyrimidine kinase/phosphomethylpyrimidine kinase [Acidobacteriaceae bacterium]
MAVALTMAGSDPSGGAGIQADLKTFHQFRVYGEAVITLLTVQNTESVSRVETVPGDFVLEQLDAVLADIPPDAAKTGALGSADIVRKIAARARRFSFPLVVDPVMISKHGAALMSRDASEFVKRELIPCATVLTPNIPEAEFLTGTNIRAPEDMKSAAEQLFQLGCKCVLIKGGHSAGEPIDILRDSHGFVEFPGQRIKGLHTHGTGCAYSAAITAGLALGHNIRQAISVAKAYVQSAIESAPRLGRGHGPINHFAPVRLPEHVHS